MKEFLSKFDRYLGKKMKSPYFPLIFVPITLLTFLAPMTTMLSLIALALLGFKFLR